MIEKAPTLKISGKVYDFYFADFQNNGSASPSTMTVGYVLKTPAIDSTTVESEHISLEARTPTEIKIYKSGSSSPAFIFRGYPVSSSIVKSTERNTLEVKYIDESNVLDKKYVGLKGKFGPGFESKTWGNFSDIILVGKQVNPCEGIENGTVASDRCSPCVDSSNTIAQQKIECEKNLKKEIRDVVYTLPELLDKLTNNLGENGGVKIEKLPDSTLNVNYFARYTGTVREVLNNWCNDYGLNFYWDYNFGIRFVDLKNGIEINDSSIRNTSCRILGYTDKKSIEENSSFKMITYFGEDGKEIKYNCNTSNLRSITLKPLLLRDLVSDKNGEIDATIIRNYKTMENFFQCCMYASYSPVLRDMFVMYEIYGIKEYKDFLDYIITDDDYTDKGELKKSLEKKVLHLMGNTRVKYVFSNYSPNSADRTGFEFFLNQLPAEQRQVERIRQLYFMVAERSEEAYNKTLEIESALGKNFIGQYWYRFYSTVNRSVSPQIISPGDGSATYYKAGDEMQFDFAKDLPASIKYLSEFIKVEKETNQSSKGKSKDNFILMKRAASWVPSQNAEDTLKFVNEMSKYATKDLGYEQIMGLLKKDDRVISFYFNFEEKEEEVGNEVKKKIEFIKNIKTQENIDDKKKVNQVYKQGNGIYTYGLRSAKCSLYRIKNGSNKLDIYTPSQSFDRESNNFQGIDSGPPKIIRTHGGYKIFTEEVSSSFSNTVISNKVEMVYGISGKNKNAVKTTVNYRNATQDLIRLLKIAPVERNGIYNCEYTDEYIRDLIEKFSDNLVLDEPIEKRVVQYQLGGFFPSKLGVKDGLDQINIRLDGSEGFKTYVSFTNSPKKRINESISIKEFEKYLRTRQISHQNNFDTNGVPPSEVI